MMKIEEIKKRARTLIGDKYYEQFYNLKSDVEFFNLYMQRNRKSEFMFEVYVKHQGSYRAFNDIWSQYSKSMDYLENAFAVFWVLKFIIKSINAEEEIFTTEEIKDFVEYFEDYLALYITDYIGDFVGCSHGCSAVAAKLEAIKLENIKLS